MKSYKQMMNGQKKTLEMMRKQKEELETQKKSIAVSYTHLTLPTTTIV